MDIVFNPRSVGSKAGEMVLTSNATPRENKISLTGVGCQRLSVSGQRFFVTGCGG